MVVLNRHPSRAVNTGLRGVLTATDFVNMGDANFRPPTESTPLIDHQKIGTGDYIGGPYDCAKFGANPSMGLLGKWVKYNEFFLFNLFYELTYRSDPSTDFHA